MMMGGGMFLKIGLTSREMSNVRAHENILAVGR